MHDQQTLQLLEERRVKGEQIADIEGAIERIDANTYRVHSQSGEVWYGVRHDFRGWSCDCADFKFRGLGKCKHTFAVELSVAIRDRVEQSRVIEPLDVQSCLFCYSKNVVKHGLRHLKSGGEIQRFTCKDCWKRFTRNVGFERLKATPQLVT